MTIRNLEHVFDPATVALIGASPEVGSIGRIVAGNLLAGGFKGPLWLVNPRHKEIAGQPSYASIADLPAAPDLAVVATPPATIPGIVAELGERGTRAAVVISAGLTADLRQKMLDAARPFLLRIQGPNCIGLMVPNIGLNASFSHRMPADGDLALLSQSGALVTTIVDWASSRGIGFSQVVSLGDMADVDFGDLLDYLAGDIHSRAILIYMEQLTHARKFMSAARRAARAKPVIVIKSGRHAEGAKAAMSHTGALAGSDAAYDAAFRRAGLLRVTELEEMFSAAEMLARVPRLDGERLMILTNGGGAGVLAADRLADLTGRLAVLGSDTQQALNAVLPPMWSHGNPVDIIGDAPPTRYAEALGVLRRAPESDAILVMNCPTAMASSTDIAKTVIDVASAQSNLPKKAIFTNWLGDGAADEARALFANAGIATFETPDDAVEGFMNLVRYSRAQDELMRTPPALPTDVQCRPDVAGQVIADALAAGRSTLSEAEAKAILAAYGIPVADTLIAGDPDEVRLAAARVLTSHKACVVKVLSDDISHKSDVGGVRLNLSSANEARDAAASILSRVARERPDAHVKGFTVQPMIHRPGAHELLIGVSEDATFGPLITFGAGGTAVEVLRDTAQALPPLDLKLARDMMRQTRVQRLLDGYRDRPAAAQDDIAKVLLRVSALIVSHPEVRELDINPLLADEKGVIALDARVRVADCRTDPPRPLSIRPYPRDWERSIDLPAIGSVLLRPIVPEDEAHYEALFKRISKDDARMRFFTARPNLSHKMIARLTQIDYAREMAFVAIDKATGALLGVSRLAADPDFRSAEYAVIIASDLKGKGLGRALMNHLIDYARQEGLSELYGLVLAENTQMLAMNRKLGFRIEDEPDEDATKRVTLELRREPAGP